MSQKRSISSLKKRISKMTQVSQMVVHYWRIGIKMQDFALLIGYSLEGTINVIFMHPSHVT